MGKRPICRYLKIYANKAADKDFCPKYKQLMQLIIKTNSLIKPNQKVGGRAKWTFLQRSHSDSQEAHGKIINITNF